MFHAFYRYHFSVSHIKQNIFKNKPSQSSASIPSVTDFQSVDGAQRAFFGWIVLPQKWSTHHILK